MRRLERHTGAIVVAAMAIGFKLAGFHSALCYIAGGLALFFVFSVEAT